MAFQISLTSNSSQIIREYKEGIPLNGPYEIGLKHFVFWNTLYNVTEKNNTLSLYEPVAADAIISHKIRVPPGLYELDNLISELEQNRWYQASHTVITLHKTTLKIVISSDWNLDFTVDNSIGQILGFSARITQPKMTSYSDLPVNISTINTVKIDCNLVSANIEDHKRNVHTLYDFPLDTAKIGGKIIKEPNPICYFTTNTDKIYDLVIKITDQDNNLLDLHGELVNLTLDFRPYGYQK